MDAADIIDRVYEAAAVPALWPTLLADISDRIGGSGAFVFLGRTEYKDAITSRDFAPKYEVFVRQGWASLDTSLERVIALNHAGFLRDQDLYSDDELAVEPIYRYFRANRMGFRAGTMIAIPNGDAVSYVFARDHECGPVPRDVVGYLDSLRPHLARAGMLAFRLGLERARAQADAMQALGLPAAVLRGAGRVTVANPSFEALVPTLFQDRTQRVTLVDAFADDLLVRALAASSHSASAVRSIPVGATDAHLPMVVHLVPVRGTAHDIFARATTLLIVTPVDRAAVPTAEVLQGLFDLTPAEARIARAIGQAQSVEEFSTSIGVSRETVRSQLKSVLAKTGVSRQQELVNLLSGVALPKGARP